MKKRKEDIELDNLLKGFLEEDQKKNPAPYGFTQNFMAKLKAETARPKFVFKPLISLRQAGITLAGIVLSLIAIFSVNGNPVSSQTDEALPILSKFTKALTDFFSISLSESTGTMMVLAIATVLILVVVDRLLSRKIVSEKS
ncbi:hypothetical protein FUAX_35360 [Fulvitalea axinellae]|uniref:Uncharacterized protein n=1 Tax=Fulvitalea axinellae TaxID=1182444 RepID=A0AAU9D953_9BACT|nr:hypothetical protein FUAX_35360 [Fulvitalea axinellae]